MNYEKDGGWVGAMEWDKEENEKSVGIRKKLFFSLCFPQTRRKR